SLLSGPESAPKLLPSNWPDWLASFGSMLPRIEAASFPPVVSLTRSWNPCLTCEPTPLAHPEAVPVATFAALPNPPPLELLPLSPKPAACANGLLHAVHPSPPHPLPRLLTTDPTLDMSPPVSILAAAF